MAGTSVDLLFFPIDTVKTRLQSPQGFVRSGGFKGIYKGIGSVVVGSAPGGVCIVYGIWGMLMTKLAAAFFSTYDTIKRHTPLEPHLAPLTHILAASVGEVVCPLNSIEKW